MLSSGVLSFDVPHRLPPVVYQRSAPPFFDHLFLPVLSGAVANRNVTRQCSQRSPPLMHSRSHTWVGMAAQIDQIGCLINLSRDRASTALRIPCVGDELMGFPEEYRPSIGSDRDSRGSLTHQHPLPPNFAQYPCSRLQHGDLHLHDIKRANFQQQSIR